MKRNIFGVIIVILSIINIIFTLSLFFFFKYEAMTIAYMIGGTILSILLIYLIVKKNRFGYLGIIIFYGLQIVGTTMVFQNYRYGLGIQIRKSLEFIIPDFTIEINFTALILFVFGIMGLKKLKKKVINTVYN